MDIGTKNRPPNNLTQQIGKNCIRIGALTPNHSCFEENAKIASVHCKTLWNAQN